MRRKKRYVGFYWTRPAPRVGFASLPDDVDEAADVSRTICYRRDLVRRWVKEANGDLIAERVAPDIAPDRDADAIAGDACRAAVVAQAEGETVAMVDFSARANWRQQWPVRDTVRAAGAELVDIYPDAIVIDGEPFDPIAHFRSWRALDAAATADKPGCKAALIEHIEQHGIENATWPETAAWLNAEGYRTLNGKTWTGENVRKVLTQ